MKKFLLVPSLALAMSLGTFTPAHAGTFDNFNFSTIDPVAILICLLLPAIQQVG